VKVLLIAHKNPYPPDDGGKMGIYTMIEGLLSNNIQLDVLLMNPTKIYRPLEKSLVPKKINYIDAVTIDTNVKILPLIYNLLFQKESYFVTRFIDKNFEKKLEEILTKNNYDIVQLESIFSAVYLPLIKQYSNKIVLRAHNIEHQIWEKVCYYEKNIFKKWYLKIQTERLKKFEESIFNQVDGITTFSEDDKQYILSLFPDKPIVVTPNGLDMQKFEIVPFEQQKLNTIFYLGSLDWIPNQQGVVWFLKNVWPKVLERKNDVQLIVAGKKIPQWLKDFQVKNVRFYSDVPDTKELYHQYAITIVPLLAGSGIRVRIIEGMAYGKCIVSTSIGAEGIPCEHNKNIIIADTPEDFAQEILDLLDDPNKVKSIQQEARKFAEENFSKEKVYLPLVKLYQQICNKLVC
jgi:glycosyltransferase involved in cell wall biosynthesis